MTEEFNIFQNLEDLKKVNLLDQLKSLESANSSEHNDSQDLDNDSFDFDLIVSNNNVKSSPTKRQRHNEKTLIAEQKKKKKDKKSRRDSVSTEGSISPTLPFLENLSKQVEEMPIGRRTRRSFGRLKEVKGTDAPLEMIEASSSKTRGKGKRGRGRGRGKGRGSSNLSANSHDPTSTEAVVIEEESSEHSNSNLNIMESSLHQSRRGRLRVMQSRRQCLAEVAARSTQIDFIDLVTSPMLRVEGFINLDSDAESQAPRTRSKKKTVGKKSLNSSQCNGPPTKNNDNTLNISYDEDNPELNIKVNWKGKPEAFKLRKYQKFSIIFKQIAERENIDIESIVFNLHDRIILADDTPDSINYKVFQFIDGRKLLNRFNSPKSTADAAKKRDTNKITLKIQSDKWKRPLQIDIKKTDKFRILYIKCSEELNIRLDELKLSFDGELLEQDDTPNDLDLEGGEAIDLHIKK